jgi:hypothetical protein
VILRLAAVAATALLLTSCGPAKEAGPGKPTATSTSAAPASHRLDIDGLTRGDDPKVAWARGRLLDGAAAKKVFPAGLDQFARTKQLLVIRDIEGNVYAYGPDGPANHSPIGRATGGLAVNAERNLVAWIAPDGSPTVLQEGEARPAVLQKEKGVLAGDAVAVLGHDCFNGPETVEGAGCTVYFRSSGTDTPQSYAASNHGFVTRVNESFDVMNLQDADEHGDIGWTKINDDQTTCSAYTGRETLDADTARTWKTCDFMPLAFSRDGKHILATGAHGYEGLGASSLTILDRATGKPDLTVRNDAKSQAAIVDMQWEDDDHVLAVVFQHGTWAIVRVAIDGSAELAAKPVRGDETDIAYRLAVQP